MHSIANVVVPRVTHFRNIALGESTAVDTYRGIPIFAEKGLHNASAKLMHDHGLLTPGTRVLEVACGAGGMTQRLGDEGLSVLGLDALPENFRASGPGISSRFADLNKPFEIGLSSQFDLVVAMEIIEHLEAPRAFLRSCFTCLRPGGHLFLTTPNVDSSYSLASLALNGVFTRFDDNYIANDGHIMPLVRHQLLAALRDAGFTIEAEHGFGQDRISLRAWPKFWLLEQIIRRLRGSKVPERSIAQYILRRPG